MRASCRPSLPLDGYERLKVCATIGRKCSGMKRYEALHLELRHFYMPPKCMGFASAAQRLRSSRFPGADPETLIPLLRMSVKSSAVVCRVEFAGG